MKLNPAHTHPGGTRVVLKESVGGHPVGAAGVIVRGVARVGAPYEVRFADGEICLCPPESVGARTRTLEEVLAGRRVPDIEWRDHALYVCVTGSRAYGLAHEDSDEDVRGVYAAPPEDYLGLPQLAPPPEIKGKLDPETKRPLAGQDWVFWEVRRFVELLLKGSPSQLEVLSTPIVKETSGVGEALRASLRLFLSRQIGSTYAGFAISQMEKMAAEVYRNVRAWQKWREAKEAGIALPEPDVPDVILPHAYPAKHAMHLLRLVHAGTHVLRTGEMMVEVPEHLRRDLLEIRRAPPPFEEVRQEVIRLVQTEFDPALASSPLPEAPDYEAAHDLLLWIRRVDQRERVLREVRPKRAPRPSFR